MKEINALGHKKIASHGDQEQSILALKDRIKELVKVDIVLEKSPAGEHQSNGEVENAECRMRGMVKTLKMHWSVGTEVRFRAVMCDIQLE